MPGAHNDINVLDRSPLFQELYNDQATPVNFAHNGHSYVIRYYLTDGIYPNYATLVKTISFPQSAKKKVIPVYIYIVYLHAVRLR